MNIDYQLVARAAESLFSDFGLDAPENAASDIARAYVDSWFIKPEVEEYFAEAVWERYFDLIDQREV